MTYFQDLTPYEYFQGEKGVLNAGWLSVDYPFPRGEVQPKFVDALAILAHNPDNLCRGFHTCDICCPSIGSYDLGGRKIGLGNGEIRVVSQDQIRRYSAPTLIVHYVAVHNYLPPTDFIEAVMKHASSKFVVRGELLMKIRMLNMRKRYRLCLSSLHYCAKWLIWFGSPSSEPDKDDLAVDRVAMALEYGFQLGLSIDVLQDYFDLPIDNTDNIDN